VATIDKDFRVKNGLVVALGGSFGGAVEVGTPTENVHAATKEYVDGKFTSVVIPTESGAPANPVDGQFYFDTVTRHLSVYSADAEEWIMIATFEDTYNLRQHIHDTSIDGNGLIVTVFQDAGYYDAIFSVTVDGGLYSVTTPDGVFDGGNPTDPYN
jgi:hypothetical protein